MAPKSLILIGVVILAYLAVDEWTRRGRPALRRGEARLSPWWNWRTFVPLFIALLLALLMARPFTGEETSPPYLISAYVVAVGVLVSWYQARRAERAVRARLDKQVADLVLAFRSTYQLQPAIFSTLEEARDKVDQPLRGWVTSTVQVFNVTSSASRALTKLRKKADNPYLHQFVYILEMSEEAGQKTVLEALEDLADRLRRHEELRNKTETEMGAITGQTRVIQLVSLGAIFIIAVISSLRSAYSSQAAQLFFIGLASIATVASYYIDQRILSLKEKIT
jgi:Flp pilus assembly protein TadB